MAKQITRTMERHTIQSAKISALNGEVKMEELEPVVLFNQGVNQEKALREIQKVYGKKDQYVITGIVSVKETYAIDFDKFMELAEITNVEEV